MRDQNLLDQLPSQPLRVVLDSQLQFPPNAKMLEGEGRVVMVTTMGADSNKVAALEAAGVEVVQLTGEQQVSIPALLAWLAEQQVNNVMLEAGAVLNGAFLAAQAIDEIVLYQAMHLMGDNARGLFHLPAISEMQQRVALQLKDCRQVGDDLRLTLAVN